MIDSPTPLRLLIIDDLPSIHDDFRKILIPVQPTTSVVEKASLLFGATRTRPQSPHFVMDSAFQGEEGAKMVAKALAERKPYSLAFVDMRMPPGWDGLETIRQLWKTDPKLQVVICTAHSDYTWTDLNTLLGTSDNLIILKKPFDNIEVQQLAHALTSKWVLAQKLDAHINELDTLVQERTAALTKANLELKNSHERFRLTLAAAQQGLYDLNVKTLEINTSDEYAKILGFDPSLFVESFEAWLERMPEEERPRVEAEFNAYIRSSSSFFSLEYKQLTKAGSVISILMRGNVVESDDDGHPLRILGTIADVTERRLAEQRMQRSQRLECIGSLASGIAHDINNTLVPQIAGISLLRPFVPSDKSELLDLMALSANRTAAMVMQLLHFAKGADGQRLPVSPKSLLDELQRFIQGTFPKNINCTFRCTCPSSVIVGDPTQLHQIMLNLCVNARDAMPEGGSLTVDLSLQHLEEKRAETILGGTPGAYICLSVKDTGTGIPESIRENIFVPFFTTKGPDKGTGLGLSTVLGIAKGHGGFVDLHTARGQGTTFEVFLPNASIPETDTLNLPEEQRGFLCKPSEMDLILFVDDEAPIRGIASMLFKDSPWRVYPAANASEAVALFGARKKEIALALVDIAMPQEDGRALIRRLLALDPTLPIIATSGNFSKPITDELRGLGVTDFLAKPFDRQALFAKIQSVLGN